MLVDADRVDGGDSREDIERWGTAVAWAEDHTSIERWDSPDAGEDWRTLIGVPYRYMTWWIEDEDATAWGEIDSAGWVRRYIEAKDLGQIYTAAASLEEVMAAGDAGGVEVVRAYEAIYGVAPEAPLPPDAEPTPTPIADYEFVRRWITARDELGANQQPTYRRAARPGLATTWLFSRSCGSRTVRESEPAGSSSSRRAGL